MPLSTVNNALMRDALRELPPEPRVHPSIFSRQRGGGAGYRAPRIPAPGGMPGPGGGTPPGPGPGSGSIGPPLWLPEGPFGVEGYPLWASLLVAIGEVDGIVLGPMPGPGQLRGGAMTWRTTTSSTAPPQVWFRVDLSEDDLLQTFTFSGTTKPTGGTPDGLTLFPFTSHKGGTEPDYLQDNDGWVRPSWTATVNDYRMPLFVSRWIPYPRWFLKFYVNNDQATAPAMDLHLLFEQSLLPPVSVIWEPPAPPPGAALIMYEIIADDGRPLRQGFPSRREADSAAREVSYIHRPAAVFVHEQPDGELLTRWQDGLSTVLAY